MSQLGLISAAGMVIAFVTSITVLPAFLEVLPLPRAKPVEEKKRRKPKTYLETLDLSQMDLIAIIISPKGNWAMVRDAKGLGYVIRKGTLIGTNEGVVDEIREKEVVVRERHRDYRGRVKTKDVAKKLLSQ